MIERLIEDQRPLSVAADEDIEGARPSDPTPTTPNQAVTLPYGWSWLLLPVVATAGGAWAFADPVVRDNATAMVAALALVVGGWLPLWQAVVQTDWAEPLARWRHWTDSDPLPRWPYVQPGTPGAALHTRISQARAWWHQVGRRTLLPSLRLGLLGFSVSLLLSIVLGRIALMLSLGFITCTELTVLWHEGQPEAGAGWIATATVGLPWLLGATLTQSTLTQSTVGGPGTAEATITSAPALSALVLVLLIGFYASASWRALVGPVVGAGFMVWQGHPVAAGWLTLLALPGLLVLVYRPDTRSYRRAIAPWTLAMVGLMAVIL